jgi:hypothetical protein
MRPSLIVFVRLIPLESLTSTEISFSNQAKLWEQPSISGLTRRRFWSLWISTLRWLSLQQAISGMQMQS